MSTPVAFSADGGMLATGYADGRARLWRAATGQLIGTLSDPGGSAVDSVTFSPDGTTLATGDKNGQAFLWQITGASHPSRWPARCPIRAGVELGGGVQPGRQDTGHRGLQWQHLLSLSDSQEECVTRRSVLTATWPLTGIMSFRRSSLFGLIGRSGLLRSLRFPAGPSEAGTCWFPGGM